MTADSVRALPRGAGRAKRRGSNVISNEDRHGVGSAALHSDGAVDGLAHRRRQQRPGHRQPRPLGGEAAEGRADLARRREAGADPALPAHRRAAVARGARPAHPARRIREAERHRDALADGGVAHRHRNRLDARRTTTSRPTPIIPSPRRSQRRSRGFGGPIGGYQISPLGIEPDADGRAALGAASRGRQEGRDGDLAGRRRRRRAGQQCRRAIGQPDARRQLHGAVRRIRRHRRDGLHPDRGEFRARRSGR